MCGLSGGSLWVKSLWRDWTGGKVGVAGGACGSQSNSQCCR